MHVYLIFFITLPPSSINYIFSFQSSTLIPHAQNKPKLGRKHPWKIPYKPDPLTKMATIGNSCLGWSISKNLLLSNQIKRHFTGSLYGRSVSQLAMDIFRFS
jgi:hypothetical protein